MFIEITFLDLVFRLSLFSLLAYKVSSLIKSYAIPFLYDQMTLERNQQMALLEKEKLLVSTQHRIENQIFNQKQMFTLLEKDVQVWHKALLDERDILEKENKRIIETIQEKRIQQKKVLTLNDNISHAIPEALNQALLELTNKYSGSQGQDLLRQVITQLPTHITHKT